MRFWVIFNNQFRPVPVVVAPNWPAVIQRAMETSTRAATATAVRHLFAITEISRLKRQGQIRGAYRVNPRRLVPAGSRNVHQREHEQFGGPRREDGRGPG